MFSFSSEYFHQASYILKATPLSARADHALDLYLCVVFCLSGQVSKPLPSNVEERSKVALSHIVKASVDLSQRGKVRELTEIYVNFTSNVRNKINVTMFLFHYRALFVLRSI